MCRSGALIALTLLAVSCTGGSFLIETESFDNKGGWLADHQAFEKIHSSYLLAHGKGTPVEDATTAISVPSPGRYHVYASTYNWTSPWYDGEGPGAFQIAVDGDVLPEILGTKGDRWGWQYAGCVDLNETATLSLISQRNGRLLLTITFHLTGSVRNGLALPGPTRNPEPIWSSWVEESLDVPLP